LYKIIVDARTVTSIVTTTTTTTIPNTISLGKKTITAYSGYESCDYRINNECLAADGKPISENTIACPRQYKLGTYFLIDGKKYICRDRTNIMYGYRFDLWFGYGYENYLRAKEFGIQQLEVEMIK